MKLNELLFTIKRKVFSLLPIRNEGFRVLSTNPVNDIDISCYKEDFKRIFGNPDNKSIAFLGAIGSGKNSVIESYKKANSSLRFLHIGHVHGNCGTGTAAIEGELINHLIHEIHPKKIPQTRFPIRKQKEKLGSTVGLIFTIIVLLISTLHIIHFDKWHNFARDITDAWLTWAIPFFKFSATNGARILSGIIWLFAFVIVLYLLIRKLRYQTVVKKITLKNSEIELFVESKAPYFDSYKNDVVYLFENVNADVIVFEDIDQCFTYEILARIMDVNSLVNKQVKLLRFLFLMPSNCLSHSEMNKLFNYSFSIVGYSVSERFYDLLHKSGIARLLSINDNERFYEKIANELQETRALIEICNKITALIKEKGKQELCYEKLIARIVLSIYFEDEYQRLINRDGVIYYMIKNKNSLIPLWVDSKTNLLQQGIDKIKSEPLHSVEELDLVYEYKISKAKNEEEKRNLITEKTLRCSTIENRTNNAVAIFEKEIKRLRQIKRKYSPEESLCKILANENAVEIFSLVIDKTQVPLSEHPHLGLLIFFVQNGYIDESYEDYLAIGNPTTNNHKFGRGKL